MVRLRKTAQKPEKQGSRKSTVTHKYIRYCLADEGKAILHQLPYVTDTLRC